MITIISKRRFGFRNPNPDKDILRTGLGPNAPKFHEAYFVTAGTGELEQAPEWINRKLGPDKAHPLGVDLNIQNILTWERAKKDGQDRKSTRLNSSHQIISYAVFCLKKKKPSS